MSDSGIHIKPSHRGRLTELKERTGKSEAELYNDGNPAHKKMVVFARNARKWNHAEGGELNPDDYNTLLVNVPDGFVPQAPALPRVNVPYSTEQPRVERKYADKWDRISNDRYKMANDALLRSGASKVDADRLARFLGAQSALEAGWVDDVSGHNYAGYMSNGKRMKFDNADAFWDYHVSNLDKKWPTWRNAQTIREYYDTVNNTALGLTTKELFDEYNRKHRDNPAYIYAPDWENSSYLKKLQGVYDKYITKYVKPRYSAGGLIEKYGVDRIRAAINQMRRGGEMHRYDGESEPTGQMNSDLWYNPDFGTYELLPEATVVAPQTVVFNGRRVAVGDGPVSGGGERGAVPADVVASPVQREGLLRQFPREGDMSPIADVFENDIVNARVHGRGDAGVIQGALSKVRNMSRDELSAFQRELYRAGYYGEVNAPKITAKTRDDVVRLQQMLKDAGYGDMLGTTGKNKDGVDGSLGSKTRAAWAAYVKDNEPRALEDSVADGRFGPATRRAAEAYYKDRKERFDMVGSDVVRFAPVAKIDKSQYDEVLSDYGQLSPLRIGDGIYGGLVDAMNLAGFKRAREKAIESGNVGEDGVPVIDYGWAVTQDQLRRAAGFLPANLDINSQPEWQGINYRDTWDSPEYIAQNASGLGTMLKGMPGVLGMAGTSLSQPGRGTIGGFVWRTTPQGIEISDGYQFAAPASAVTIRDAQGDAYNGRRIEIANSGRARNIRQQRYLVPWDIYRKLQEKRR